MKLFIKTSFLFLALFVVNQQILSQRCDVTVEITQMCKDNGTPCDPTDDFYQVFALVQNGVIPGMFQGEIGGRPIGPLPFAPLPNYLGDFPADRTGPVICGDFWDVTDPSCGVFNICTEPLFPCSDTFNRLKIQSFECNDNMTANDPSDDYYIVRFNGITPFPRWTHQFEIHNGPDVYGPFPYGSLNSITLPANGGFERLDIVDVFDPYCNNFQVIGPLDPCSVPCEQTATLIDTVCDDNGTPDPGDDLWIVTLVTEATTAGMSNISNLSTQFVPKLPLSYNQEYKIPIPAKGQTQILFFSDNDYVDCNDDFEIGPLDPCSIFCEISVDSIILKCDNKGTPDDADDEIEVCMFVTDSAGGSGYHVQIKGDRYGPFEYGKVGTIVLPADGQSFRFNFIDVDFPDFCKTFDNVGPLDPCSYPCEFVINSLIPECDDKGTPDINDDTYSINFNITYIQGTVNDSFWVELNGMTYGPFAYDEDNSFNVPADGGTYEIIFKDFLLAQYCQIKDTIGPLNPCSSECELDIEVTNITCDNNGTGLDPSDDSFSFNLRVNGQNVGSGWMVNDPAMTSANYGNTRLIGPFLISGGNVLLTITDQDDPFCQEVIEIMPPATCSDSCFIEVLDFEIGPCDDNSTGEDDTDDFFFVDILVDGQNVSASNTYTVEENGTIYGPFTYGITETVGPLPANGNNLILIIQDEETGYCEVRLTVSQDPCSDCSDVADAGPNKIITCSDNQVGLEGSGSSPGTYVWVGPNGRTYNGPNPMVGEPGTYVLTVTFAKGCTSVDSVVVSRDVNLPISDPGADANLTCIVDSILVGGPNSSSGPNIVYEWTDVNGNVISTDPQFTTGDPGSYCLRVIDTLLDCESAVNCVQIGETRDAPSGNILVNPNNAFDCRVDSILLNLENTSNSDYVWEKNTVIYNSDSLWVTDTGMIYVILTDTITGCTSRLSVMINSLIDYPVIAIARPDTITCLKATVTINANNSQSGPKIFHQWFDLDDNPIPGATGRQLQVTDPGSYIFESIDDETGCVNRDTVQVNEDRFFHTADAGADKIIKCDSSTVILNAGGSTQMNNISYSWRSISGGGTVVQGAGTLFPEVDAKGRYELTVRDDISGCESLDTVFVDQAFAPSIDLLSVKGEQCGGDESGSIRIAGISGIRPLTYELNGRPVTETNFDSLKPGLFFFRVTDSLGCRTDTLLEVKEGNYLDYKIEGDTFVIRGDSTTLEVTSTLPDDQVDQVYWSEDGSVFCFRCYSITVKPDTTTIYTFRLIDINGCEIEFDFEVRVQNPNKIFVPNIFTPNGDTENEVLHVFGKYLTNIDRIMIFNRWGELVFKGENLPPGPIWDGRWNGELHVPAVLTYVIDATFEDGEQKQFVGDITLLR